MSKGAQSSGGGKANGKAKDQAMAAHLPPAPKSYRQHPERWPYHNNLGAKLRRAKKGQ